MIYSEVSVGDYGWDDDETVQAYESFSATHDRYMEANLELVENADLENALYILDVAAGIGATTASILIKVGPETRVVCVEPSMGMRNRGQALVQDPRVSWLSELPNPENFSCVTDYFDRIICGAAIWQILPLDKIIKQLGRLLKPGGAVCFNIPAQYLGEADQEGDGEDPNLLELSALLVQLVKDRGLELVRHTSADTEPVERLSQNRVDKILRSNGFLPTHWCFNYRLTQAAYKDWLKIPVISNGIFPGLQSSIREQLIEEAYQQLDTRSWRWECWRGWAAWKIDS